MADFQVPFRQIHMDFHTSEAVNSVGELFDPEEFAKTLKDAYVNYCAVFARCHHGYLYYESEIHKNLIHPKLNYVGMLEAQIKALKKEGIRVPVYTTVQWDHFNYMKHPEWRIINADGGTVGWKPLEDGFHGQLCVNSGYRDFLKVHTKELFDVLPEFDGIFFDIINARECCCEHCIGKMKEAGLNPLQKDDRIEMARRTVVEFTDDMTAFVRSMRSDPEFSIYYNNTSLGPEFWQQDRNFTHQEFDCLPSQNIDGYEIFGLKTRFIRNVNDCIGQTGKFHGGWGDMHSLKNRAALEYEAFMLLALNCKILVGDQLMPSGKLDQPTYDLIGSVYKQVAQKEAWCTEAQPVVDTAIFCRGPITVYQDYESKYSEFAATRLLTELGCQFDVIDKDMDFGRYKLIILPDRVRMTEEIRDKFGRYVKDGGAVIASFESGIDAASGNVSFNELGISLKEQQVTDDQGEPVYGRFMKRHAYSDYIVPRGAMAEGLYETEYTMYTKGRDIQVKEGTESLCDMVWPEFFRTRDHFCSHHQAPSSGMVQSPAVTRRGKVIYFAHPIFDIYHMDGAPWVKKLLKNAISLLVDEPLVNKEGPLSLAVTVNEQKKHSRYVMHLVNYIIERKSFNRSVIDEVIPVYNTALTFRTDKKIVSAMLVPENEPVDFQQSEGIVKFKVEKINGHQMIELVYE